MHLCWCFIECFVENRSWRRPRNYHLDTNWSLDTVITPKHKSLSLRWVKPTPSLKNTMLQSKKKKDKVPLKSSREFIGEPDRQMALLPYSELTRLYCLHHLQAPEFMWSDT